MLLYLNCIAMSELKTDLYDLNLLSDQVGNDTMLLKKFTDMFLTTMPVDMQTLEAAIKSGDWEKSRSTSHKMKSSFLIMGADWARDICLQMEAVSRNAEETKKLPELYRELSEKFSNMVTLLSRITF